MSYTTTITFPVKTINQNTSPNETIQVILEFTHDLSGTNRSWTAAEKNLRIVGYGRREMRYDIEDALLAVQSTSMEIGDPEGWIYDILFGTDSVALATDIKFKVTKKINGVEKFVGYAVEDNIKFSKSKMVLSFRAIPQTDKLNKKLVYDTVGNILCPVGFYNYLYTFLNVAATAFPAVGDVYSFIHFGETYWFKIAISYDPENPTNLIAGKIRGNSTVGPIGPSVSGVLNKISGSGDDTISFEEVSAAEQDTLYPIPTILEKIFQLVNPSLTFPSGIDINHNWNFQGKRNTTAIYLNNILLGELWADIEPLFFDNSYEISNCGDVLKRLALEWCSAAGMLSNNKAFLQKLLWYNENNIQSVEVLDWEPGYRYGLIDYVKITTGISGPDEPYEEGELTSLESRFIERKALPGFYYTPSASGTNQYAVVNRSDFCFDHGTTISPHPSEGDVYSNNGSEFTVIGTPYPGAVVNKLATERTSGTNAPDASGTLTLVSGTGPSTITYTSVEESDGTYYINRVRDAELFSNAFKDHGALLANFWYTHRGNILNCRVDKFKLRGVNYDFLKCFPHSGFKFQPISMTHEDAQGYTECEAIYLGEV